MVTQVTNDVLANNAVGTNNIIDGAVTSTKFAAGSITKDLIPANAIDGTKIALGSDAIGDLMYYNGTDWARLPAGTDGSTLRSNGAAAPTWDSPSYIKLNGNNGTDIAFTGATQLLTSTYYIQEFADGGISWNSTSGAVTVSTAGIYQVDFFLYVRASLSPNNGRYQIRKNGGLQAIKQTGLSIDGTVQTSLLMSLAAGNYVDITADTFDLGAVYMGFAHTGFSMHRIK